MKKITFVIPLRAPESCNNWESVSKACIGTLQSIANQSLDNYQCLLVCHEPPKLIPDVKNLEILKVGFPIPINAKEQKTDKGSKIKQAINYYKVYPSEFSMNVDADDRIHKDLVAYIDKDDTISGWRCSKGYVYSGGLWVRCHNGGFDKLCGTSIVSRTANLIDENNPTLIGHCEAKKYYERLGKPLQELPFFSAVKVVGYGDNITETKFLISENIRRTTKKLLMMRYATKSFRKAFAFDSNPV